ncbi:unnamed protein product [Closterium sp. NIES-53]
MAAQELRWLTYLLTDLGEWPRSPPVMYVNNKAAIALCQEHRLEHRTKHIALRYFLARELQQRGQLRLTYVASRANTADIFTKALPPGDHQQWPRSPPVMYVNNKAAIALCQEHRLEHRTKHIALRYFLARELQQRGQLRLTYVASRANTADIFTKALPPGDHQPCFVLPTWPCDPLFSPTLPMGDKKVLVEMLVELETYCTDPRDQDINDLTLAAQGEDSAVTRIVVNNQ